MEVFRPEKTVFAVQCLLTVLAAVFSGSVYPISAQLYGFAVLICFFLSFSGRPLPAFASVWPALPYLFILYASSIWSISVGYTLDQAFFFTVLVMFSALAAFSAGEGRARIMLVVIVAISAVISIYGIYQYQFGLAKTQDYLRAYGASELGMSGKRVENIISTLGYKRAFSTLFSPNALACYLATAMPAGMALAWRARNTAERAAYAAALVLMSTALVLTKSVGGIMAFAAGVFVFSATVTRGGDGRGIRGRPGLIVAAAVITLLVVIIVLSQRADGFRGVAHSYADRLSYFGGALRSFASFPIAGSGGGSFSLTYLEWIKPGGGESRYAHNVLLQTLAETGVTGLAALVVLFAAYFTRCIRLVRSAVDDPVPVALLAGGAAFLVHNMLDFTFYVQETSSLFWLYFGLAASYVAPGHGTGRRRDVLAAAGVAVVALVFAFFFGRSALASMWKSEALDLLESQGFKSSVTARSKPVPDEAVGLVREAVSLKPYDDNYHALLGNLYEGMAYTKGHEYALKAEREYIKASSLNTEYPYHKRDLGILYLKLGRTADARRCFQEAIGLYPSNMEFRTLLNSTEN